MANSKRKTILNALRDTVLAYMTTGHGFNSTVTTIERGLREIESVPVSAFPAVYLSRSSEVRENITRNQFKSTLTLVIVGYVRVDSAGSTGAQEALDDLIEDICKALEQDRTQGGLAKWTEIKSVDTDDGDLQNLAACAITVELIYATEGVTP